MSILDNYFPIGLGTARFSINSPNDEEGIEKSVELVLTALENGVNYIDTSHTYSVGMAHTVLKQAFSQTNKKFDVTVKSLYRPNKTADDVRREVEMQLENMGLDKAKFFLCWSIFNFNEFEEIQKKNGIYEGALKLKEEGLIYHICCSTHSTIDESIKYIESGLFDTMTISYSLLNAVPTQELLDKALIHNMPIAVMNPLAGGIIPQNQEVFSYAKCNENESTIDAALKFALSHKAVKVLLNGANNSSELLSSINAVKGLHNDVIIDRNEQVLKKTIEVKDFCTGCKYCQPCPKGIDIPMIMQSLNTKLFKPVNLYNREEQPLLGDLQVFRRLNLDFNFLPETGENPCVNCGKCEKNCTQKLSIISSINELYDRIKVTSFNLENRKERLNEILVNKDYKKVALYPNGGFSDLVIKYFNDFFGHPTFEWVLFNTNKEFWGSYHNDLVVNSPNEIKDILPDIIIVTTYRFDDDIYNDLFKYEKLGIKIIKLHKDTDVPWVY